MATSGSTDFSVNASEIIKDAMIEINAIAPSETPTSDEYSHARRVLNYMTKHWQTQGYNLFRRERGTISIVANKGTDTTPYTLGTGGDVTYRPLRIENMRYKPASGSELPMMEMNRWDYDALPDKTTAGTPTNFHYDPQNATAELFIWPVKSTSSGTLIFTYQRAIEDFDSTSNDPDYPQEWYEALKYSLAYRLHGSYFTADPQRRAELLQLAQTTLQSCLSFDRETAPLKLERVR